MLREKIAKRQAVNRMHELNIAHNPHSKEPKQLFDYYQKQIKQMKKEEKIDRTAFHNLKRLMQDNAKRKRR